MNRTERLYALVEELRAASPRPVSASALAERFEVSTRTIERDLQALLEARVPLWTERGRRGGYALDRRASLPPLNFTPEEAAAVAIALATTGQFPLSGAARRARQKLVGAMSAAGAEEARALVERIRVAPQETIGAPEVIRTVREAVLAGEVVELDYTDRHGERTTREVEAHGLYGAGPHWALVGWCRLRQEGRCFRLDRIGTAKRTGTANERRDFTEVLGWMPPEFQVPDLAE